MYTADRLQKRQENKSNSSENDKAALAFFIDMKFTVDQWRKLRAYSKKYNNYFPIYDRIMKEKKKCYPENIEVTDKSASICNGLASVRQRKHGSGGISSDAR